jgi:transcriptional regulator with XRE-family HTH domain
MISDFLPFIGKTLMQHRWASRLTREALANLLSVTESAIERAECGEAAVDVLTFWKLSELFEVSPADLFEQAGSCNAAGKFWVANNALSQHYRWLKEMEMSRQMVSWRRQQLSLWRRRAAVRREEITARRNQCVGLLWQQDSG